MSRSVPFFLLSGCFLEMNRGSGFEERAHTAVIGSKIWPKVGNPEASRFAATYAKTWAENLA